MDDSSPDYKFDILVVKEPKWYESSIYQALLSFGQSTGIDNRRRHTIERAKIELYFRRYAGSDASECVADYFGTLDGSGVIFFYDETRPANNFNRIKRFSDNVKRRSYAGAESIVIGKCGDPIDNYAALRSALEHGLIYRDVSIERPTTIEQVLLELVKRLLVKAHEKRVEALMTEQTKNANQVQSDAGNGNLAHDIEHLLEIRELCDFTLETSDGSLRVHKTVLGARSAVFRAMFRSEWRESTEGVLKLDLFDTKTIEKFIKFLYTDKLEFEATSSLPASQLDDSDIKLVANLISLSKQFELPKLRESCKLELNQTINLESVLEILKIGNLYEVKTLKRNALAFIKRHKHKLDVDHLDATLTQFNGPSRKEIIAALIYKQPRS